MRKIKGLIGRLLLGIATSLLLATTTVAEIQDDSVSIVQSRGVDQRVVYRELTKYGPWDDRNYQLNAADLGYLSPDEDTLYNQLPAFFRVELRKQWPHLRKTGPAQYPRAALQMFGHRYGGLMQNGKIKHDRRLHAKAPMPVGKEVQLNEVLGANEITVEINPANPQLVVAGANNAGGQEMYYSVDGGSTWTVQGVLPNTCCDPTVDWSSDGNIAYAASLSGPIGVSAWRSFDGGQTWVDRVDVTAGGSDKEFIHVDKSPSSPYQDSVYLTYHDGNIMQFARSTDNGVSYDIQAFPSDPFGIGSDITTDSAGNIYYFYAAFMQKIIMLKSTDGGTTFSAGVEVASTNSSFDFPIPSMETRRVFTYASADTDRSGGSFDGSVYVAWTDSVDPENDADPDANNARIYVAYSRDQGATWTLSTPHSTGDMDNVDRWHQWLSVDEFGNVHIVFYDTRNSVDRTGVDLYYASSADGGVTWTDPERVSTATSANLTDGQEFGDYNGLSVIGDKVISTWTDNRDGPPNQKDVYADDATNVLATPGFTLSASPGDLSVCAPGSLDDITVNVGSVLDFVEPATLNLANLPAGFSGGFSINPVTPAIPTNTSVAQMTVAAVAAGDYSFDIVGSATGADDRTRTIDVNALTTAPVGTTLLEPVNGAIEVSSAPVLTWSAVPDATNYTVEVDDDPAFGSIDFTTQTKSPSVAVNTALASETTYYWRVRADNICGTGANSATFGFTTNLEICRVDVGAIPDAGATSDTMVVTRAGVVADLNISLQVAHTWVGDLIFTLVNEDTGASATLIDRPGYSGSGFGCSSANIDVILDDEGTAPVEDACAANPAISGMLIPNEPLSAFDFQELSGTWRLDVSDNAGQDIGTLDRWCLAPAIPDPGLDTDNDGQTDSHEIGCGSDPEDDNSLSPDFDADNIPDCADPDDDNDGVPDDTDAFPLDPGETVDTDGDGIGDNADTDDDGDGVPDVDDDYPLGRFNDAPPGYWAFTFIEALARAGITAGCGNDNYCPTAPVTRAQMAVFLERGMNGSGFVPPAATGTVFLDVGAGDFAANFIEQLAADGITAGCGNNNYCPNADVTRDQMAVFLLRAKYGAGYNPPPATGVFADVPQGRFAAAWIEQLAAEGITAGCGGGNYCPDAPVTRDQMAVFLVRTFGL